MGKEREEIGPFQILLVALSVYVLLALGTEAVVPLSAYTRSILIHIDNFICLIFLCDFFHRFALSKHKLRFLRWGWIDLVSSIPAIPVLRVGRAVRVIRVLRLLRGLRSIRTIGTVLFANRAKGTLATAGLLCVLLVLFSSVAILQVENGPDSNIRGPEDALWWSVVTITTVGYGDRYPVTTEGRIIGAGLMLCGVGLFAVLAGAFAAWFAGAPPNQAEPKTDTTQKQLSALVDEVRALRAEMHQSTLS